MESITPEVLNGAVKAVKTDWKSAVSLLLACLFFVAAVAWGMAGYVLRGADNQIQSSTARIISLESRQSLFDQQIVQVNKRQDEVLVEIKGVSKKLSDVAESQARMEGVILGSKK